MTVVREREREGSEVAFAMFLGGPKGSYLRLFIRDIIIDTGLRPLILAGSCISRKYKV